MRKKAAPTYSLDDIALHFLFDVAYVDWICEILGGLADPVPETERLEAAEALRNIVGGDIEKLRIKIIESGRGNNATEMEALENFALAVEATAGQLPGPLDKTWALGISANLRARWLEFIAYAASHRMIIDLPRELEINKRKTQAMIARRLEIAVIESVDKGAVVAEYSRRKAMGQKGLRDSVAAEFNISPNTVKNIWNKRDRTKYPD